MRATATPKHTPNIKALVNNFLHNRFPQFQLLGPDVSLEQHFEKSDNDSHQIESLYDALWFAAPKSKISQRKKKQKHLRYFPDKVTWVKCDRCGEPKQPHRICTTNIEVCGMREEEWNEAKKDYKVKQPESRF